MDALDFFDIPPPSEPATHFPGNHVHILINGRPYAAVITAITNRVGALSYDVHADVWGDTWVFPDQIVRLS